MPSTITLSSIVRNEHAINLFLPYKITSLYTVYMYALKVITLNIKRP